jgi:hypothetical protein
VTSAPPLFDFRGTAKDADAVAAWAANAGASARPVLEAAFVDGSPVVRAASARALAALDVDIDPSLASLALDVVLVRADSARELVALLASCGWGAALDAVLARLPDDDAASAIVGADALTIARLLSAWRNLDATARQQRFDGAHVRSVAGRDDVEAGPLRRLLTLALDDDTLRDEQRRRAADALFTLGTRGDLESLRALSARSSSPLVPGALVVQASLAADPIEAYEELAASYSVDAYRRRLIAKSLDANADPRWVDAALAVMDIDAEAATATLARLRTPRAAEELLALAGGDALDDVTKHALAALGPLGDPRGASLLVHWLAQPAGDAIAPLLLTALAQCGDASVLAFLEARQNGPRAAYVTHAITTIRGRTPPPARELT